MKEKITLLSTSPKQLTEKKAWAGLLRLGKAAPGLGARLSELAGRRDFLGGLAAPATKFVGGLQKVYGHGQRGAAALRQGLNSSYDDLLKNPLYQKGMQNINAGQALRSQSGLRAGLRSANPWQYRVGRGLGAVTLGAPLMNAPWSAATYLGAGNADPEIAQEYAKNMAYRRAEDRLNQFQSMPFLDRAQAVFNPQSFTSRLHAPEAEDLYQAMSSNNLNNPGILKYLASFNPFIGSEDSVINQKVRNTMMQSLAPKSASEKKAMMGQVFKGLGAAWKAGRGAATAATRGAVNGIHALPARGGIPYMNSIPGVTNIPIWEAMLQKGVYHTAKNPLTALGAGAAGTLIPYSLLDSYRTGKQHVYESAANNARGLADMQLMEHFNRPGFMNGLGRAGMAIAPGMSRNLILNNIRQNMFPEENQQQQF